MTGAACLILISFLWILRDFSNSFIIASAGARAPHPCWCFLSDDEAWCGMWYLILTYNYWYCSSYSPNTGPAVSGRSVTWWHWALHLSQHWRVLVTHAVHCSTSISQVQVSALLRSVSSSSPLQSHSQCFRMPAKDQGFTEDQIEDFKEVFQLFDTKGDGLIQVIKHSWQLHRIYKSNVDRVNWKRDKKRPIKSKWLILCLFVVNIRMRRLMLIVSASVNNAPLQSD